LKSTPRIQTIKVPSSMSVQCAHCSWRPEMLFISVRCSTWWLEDDWELQETT
jgi:hypothetical protein